MFTANIFRKIITKVFASTIRFINNLIFSNDYEKKLTQVEEERSDAVEVAT